MATQPDRQPPKRPPTVATAITPDPEEVAALLARMPLYDLRDMLQILKEVHGINITIYAPLLPERPENATFKLRKRS